MKKEQLKSNLQSKGFYFVENKDYILALRDEGLLAIHKELRKVWHFDSFNKQAFDPKIIQDVSDFANTKLSRR